MINQNLDENEPTRLGSSTARTYFIINHSLLTSYSVLLRKNKPYCEYSYNHFEAFPISQNLNQPCISSKPARPPQLNSVSSNTVHEYTSLCTTIGWGWSKIQPIALIRPNTNKQPQPCQLLAQMLNRSRCNPSTVYKTCGSASSNDGRNYHLLFILTRAQYMHGVKLVLNVKFT